MKAMHSLKSKFWKFYYYALVSSKSIKLSFTYGKYDKLNLWDFIRDFKIFYTSAKIKFSDKFLCLFDLWFFIIVKIILINLFV